MLLADVLAYSPHQFGRCAVVGERRFVARVFDMRRSRGENIVSFNFCLADNGSSAIYQEVSMSK